jgi:hypothetical protein
VTPRAARYERLPGTRVELLDRTWIAYSAASGETFSLNDEAAAVLELLDLGEECRIIEALASDTGLSEEQVRSTLSGLWPQLIDLGLIRRVAS